MLAKYISSGTLIRVHGNNDLRPYLWHCLMAKRLSNNHTIDLVLKGRTTKVFIDRLKAAHLAKYTTEKGTHGKQKENAPLNTTRSCLHVVIPKRFY